MIDKEYRQCSVPESSRPHLIAVALIIAIMSLETEYADALAVPVITADPDSLISNDIDNTVIRGSVTRSEGQEIVLLAGDMKTVIGKTFAAGGGGMSSFSLSVPAQYIRENINGHDHLTLYLQSKAVKGLTASKIVRVEITCNTYREKQSIRAAPEYVLTNLKTTSNLRAVSSSGLKLKYKSSDPGTVKVSRNGKIYRKKNGKVKITITQAGNNRYYAAAKTVTVISRKSNRLEQIDGAVSWAVRIANDNSFCYGSGKGAHHFGCYFCGTNYGPRKYMKPGKRYKKTYCCNTFISAAYAHGAKHPGMLAACKKASGIGMEKITYYRYGCWKCKGKPAYSKLQKGDVLVTPSHVAMYIGNNKLVEAATANWSAGSIAVKHMSRSRYGGFSFVMRYTGY